MLIEANSIADTLSTALSRIKLQSLVAGAFDAGGRWAVEFPALDILRLHVVLNGECFLQIEGEEAVYHLKVGDCFLITANNGFTVTNDLALKKKTTPATLNAARNGDGISFINGGGAALVTGAAFSFEGHLARVFLGSLPSVIYVPAHLDQAAILHWHIERFGAELRGKNAGRALVLNHLAPIMLLQTLKIYLQAAEKRNNWLGAIADPKLSKAIDIMHSDYKDNLSLEMLAESAGMSRANFALNFKKRVGISPIEYLNNWRMQIACELLQDTRRSISEVAQAVGYDSESAFSSAFKRIVQCRPGHYQKSLARY